MELTILNMGPRIIRKKSQNEQTNKQDTQKSYFQYQTLKIAIQYPSQLIEFTDCASCTSIVYMQHLLALYE